MAANDNRDTAEDWADDLARKVLLELGKYRGEDSRLLMAAKLRYAHALGKLDALGHALDRVEEVSVPKVPMGLYP